ncbi:hypothetical protein M9H77_22452 [Catharanthus roseus]|uniref:Uncharacterized protein n=1 Tax=Catharanthus roseus TaxID=4058 RepID=A0ACC0AQI6_CATRO|nr:hypothetical protein M9H77_22452 [Catharanthus roseus]
MRVTQELFSLMKIALPVALTTLLVFSKGTISMLFLGHMEKIELAGGSLAMGFANVTGFSVMKGLCMGMEPICSQAYGAKRFSVISQTYIRTVLLLLLTSIPITFLWLNVEPLLLRLGQDRIILKVAKTYLIYSIPELIGQAHINPLRSFLRTQGLNSAGTIVATCATALHLPITYFLVILYLIALVLPILGLAEVGNSPQTAACGALTGSARPKIGVRINMAAFYFVGIPCSAVFAFKLKIGFRGLWLGLVASQAACSSMMVYTLTKTDWKIQAKRAEELTMASLEKEKDDGGNNNLIP